MANYSISSIKIGSNTYSLSDSTARANFDNYLKVIRSVSTSTNQGGYWAAMCNSSQTGLPSLPAPDMWWHVLSMDWNGDTNYWISQLALPTNSGGVPYYRFNDSGGTNIDSSTWHCFITDANIGDQSVNYATYCGASYALTSTTASASLAAGLLYFDGARPNASQILAKGNAIIFGSPGTINDQAWIRVTGTSENDMMLEIATGDDGASDFNVHFTGYNTANEKAIDIVLPKNSGTVALTSDIHDTTVTLAGKDDSWTANFTLNSETDQTVNLDEVTAKSLYMDESYNMSTPDTTSRLFCFPSTNTMDTGSNGSSSKWSIISISNGKNGVSNSQLAVGSGYQLRYRAYFEGNSTYGTESHWGDWRDIAFEDVVSSKISSATSDLITRNDLYSWVQGYGSWNLVNTLEDKTNVYGWLYRDVINSYDDSLSATAYLLIGYVASGYYSNPTSGTMANYGRSQAIHIHGWWGGSGFSYKNQVDCVLSFYYISSTSYSISAKGWMHRSNTTDDIIVTSNGYIYLKTTQGKPRCQIFVDRNGPSVLSSSSTNWSTSSPSGTSLSSKLVDFSILLSPKITINGTSVSLGSSATINPPSNCDVILRTLSFRGGADYSISGIYCTTVSITVDGSVGSEGSAYFTAPTTSYYSTYAYGGWKYTASIVSGGYINTLCIGIEQASNRIWLKRAISGQSQTYTVQIIGVRYY